MLNSKAAAFALALAIGGPALSAQRPRSQFQTFRESGRTAPSHRFSARPISPASRCSRKPRRPSTNAPGSTEFRKNFPPEDLQAPDIDYEYMDRMKVVAGRRTSLITDPADGRLPPLLPAAKARADARPKPSKDDPESMGLDERCLLEVAFGSSNASPPMVPNPFGQNFYQIVQTDTHVVIYTEIVHDARIIRIGGTHAPPAVQLWLGDSVGRWEGDTLVVDTTNFTPKSHFRGSGTRLHVVERFTRTSPTTIRYQFTADDPETWDRPWSAEIPFNATERADLRVRVPRGQLLDGQRPARRAR